MNLWQSFSADEKNVSWWSFQRRQKFSGIVVRLDLHYYCSPSWFLPLFAFAVLQQLVVTCASGRLCWWWGEEQQLLWPQQTLRCCCPPATATAFPLNIQNILVLFGFHRVNLFNCSNSTSRLNCFRIGILNMQKVGFFSCSFQYRKSAIWLR